MAGLISDIVGGNVDSDLDKLVAKLAAVEKELDVINGKAITIKVDLQGVGTLSELTSLYKQQDEILTKLRSTSVQYVDTYKMATEAIKEHNGQTQKVVAVSDKIAATLLKEAKAREVNARTAEKEAALSERVSRQKEKETQSIEKAAAAKQKAAEREIADYNRGAAAADKAAAAKQREIEKEIANYNKGAQAAQRHADMTEKQRQRAEAAAQKYQAALQKETQAIADKLAKETAALQVADNAYIVLRNEYNKQSTALKGMIVQYGEADAAVVKMKADVDKMYTSLLKAEQAVGQHQRQVGQYQNATFALSQLIREAPSFAYGLNVGIGSLSNNFPILFDQFKRLRQEVGSTTSALKIMGASIFSFTNIFTIAYTALMLFTSGLLNFKSASMETKSVMDDYRKSLEDTNKAIGASVIEETAHAQILLDIAKNTGKSMDIRLRAVQELQSLYPDYLGNLSKEAILTGDTADAMKRLNEALFDKAIMEAYEGKIKAAAKAYADLNDKMQQNAQNVSKLLGQSTTPQGKEIIIKQGAEIRDALQKQMDKIKKEIDNYRNLASMFGQQAAPLLLKPLKASGGGGTSADKPKKDTISDDLAAAKSDYELQLLINRQKFVNSRKTYHEEQQLKDDNLKATMEYGERYTMIVEDFNNKHLITENEHIKLINEANKILLEGQIKAKEAGDKIEEEILKKKIQTNNEMIKYIESLSKQRQELEKINREIDAIQDKAASRKEYAESFAPYLEGFGFNTAFGQQVKQKNLDIAAQKAKVDLAAEAEANEGVKGSMADAIKLGQLRIKTAEETKSLRQLEAERDEMYNQKMIEGKKELARKTVELAQQAFEAINTIRNNAFAAEQKQLEIQSQNLKLRTDQEMRAIDAKAGFEASKANEKSKLAAETAAKENEIRAKSNELSLRQARANKQAAQVSIITNTAASIIKAFVDFPYPVAIPIAAALAATGAVQYSVASSAPLPQYAKGTEGTTHERFIAGEKGAELGITPSGKTMLFEKEGIYSAPLGTKIKTADQTKKLMQYAINGIGYNGESLNALNQNMHISLDDKKIVDTIKEQTHDIAVTLWKTKGNNNSSTQQAYIDAVREQQNLISKFK